MKKQIRNYIQSEDGATSVEFAIIGMWLFMTIFSILALGNAFWSWSVLQYSTERTSRYVLTHTDASDQDIEDFAKETAASLLLLNKDIDVNVSRTLENNVTMVQIDGSYTADIIGLTFLGDVASIDMSATSRMAIQ